MSKILDFKSLQKHALNKGFVQDGEEPSGASGFYKNLGFGVGVKIYYASHRTANAAIRSTNFKEATRALNMLRKVYTYLGICPKPYMVAPIKIDGRYSVGLFMQHIDGAHPVNYIKETRSVIERFDRMLCDIGIKHQDLYGHNLLKKGRKFYVIDFDYADKF